MDINLVCRSPWQWLVTFVPDDSCFAGHFPGNPIVPGSLILALCLQGVAFATPGSALTVRRFSFLRFTIPGTYTLSITLLQNTYKCVLSQQETLFAQGSIIHAIKL